MSDDFKAGAEAQRAADIKLFEQWSSDLELPFGTTLTKWHSFGVSFKDYLTVTPLEVRTHDIGSR